MRLLNVSHFYANHGGGIERVAEHSCRELAELGHVVEWAASASDLPPIHTDIVPIPLDCINPTEALTGLPMPIPRWRGMVSLRRAIGRADAIIVHDALYVTSIAALLLGRWSQKPVILVQHIAEVRFTNPLMRAAMKLATILVTRPMVRAAGHVVFISDAVRKNFETLPLRSPARLIFNGIDSAVFHNHRIPAEGDMFRATHGLPVTGKIIAFVGRFVTKKGLNVLREVALLRPELIFVLAGSGPVDPNVWGLPNVHVLGSLEPHSVAKLLRASSAMLLPSVGEGYPLVVQEALACGAPVICGLDSASADPGAAVWLHGVAIDHADPAGTARRILPLLKAAECNTNQVEMAAYAAQSYSWTRMAAALAEVCAEGITRQPTRSASTRSG